MNNIAHLIGRILFAVMFLPAGISKITGFEGTVGYIASAGLPLPALGAVIAVVVEVLGSVALIVGYQTRVAAVLLALFTLGASVFFHPFWAVAPEQAFVVQLLFFKNVAIIGGLLILASAGAGAFSLDAKRAAE